jgi:hypothetical protein
MTYRDMHILDEENVQDGEVIEYRPGSLVIPLRYFPTFQEAHLAPSKIDIVPGLFIIHWTASV